MRRGALRSALSERVREGSVIVVEDWTFDEPKTKTFIASLNTLGLDGKKTLIVDSLENEALIRSSRNVQRAKVVNSFGLNIYDLLYHETLVLSSAAANELELLLGQKTDAVEAVVEAEAPPAEEVKPKRVRKKKEEAA
jgi:large subunit ribosomal protein L4